MASPSTAHSLATLEIERTRVRLVGDGEWLMQMMARILDEAAVDSGARREAHMRHNRRSRAHYLSASPHDPIGPEKRNQARQPLQQPLHVVPFGADGQARWAAGYEAVSRNLSDGGVAIVQDWPLSTDRLMIGLPQPGQTLYAAALVRHARRLGDELVELGCCLLGRLPISLEAVPERRRCRRRDYTEGVDVLGVSGQGVGRDLSETGVAFITRWPVPLGSCILSLPCSTGSPLHARTQIIRCRSLGAGFYDVGGRFCRLDRQA